MALIKGAQPTKSAPHATKPVNLLSVEARKTLALQYLHEGRTSGKDMSIRATARKFGISHSSLADRDHGRKTRKEVRGYTQLLSPPLERVLVEWIRHWGGRGVPMTSHAIRAKAMALAGRDLGKNWLHRFKHRHPEMKSVWSTTIDAARAKQVNMAVVQDFYDLLLGELVEGNIPPQNIFNMDEKGIVCGQHERVKVWVDRTQTNTVLIGEKERDLTTVIECVSADGGSISPMIIFKGVRQSKEWCVEDDNGLNAT
jgi:Tc5 transposase DNA-binding domain/helix-turn-helix, Psq domain